MLCSRSYSSPDFLRDTLPLDGDAAIDAASQSDSGAELRDSQEQEKDIPEDFCSSYASLC